MTDEDLRDAQRLMVPFIKRVKKGAVFADMGLGKTGGTITALCQLINELEITPPILIVAPLAVAEDTWPRELQTWACSRSLTVEVLRDREPGERRHPLWEKRVMYWGARYLEAQRVYVEMAAADDFTAKSIARVEEAKREAKFCRRVLAWGLCAARRPADIVIINRENFVWLVEFFGKRWPYQTIVYDEASDLKNGSRVLRWRALRKVMGQTDRLIELTGTPAPRGLINLHGLMYPLDSGKRLLHSREKFLTQWFDEDYTGYKHTPRTGALEDITQRISDICLTLRAKDFMDLPPMYFNTIPVVLSDAEVEKYEELQREYLTVLPDGDVIEAPTAASLRIKLLQLANGHVYDSEKIARAFHYAKLDAMENYISEQQGENVLCAYYFQHDLAAIRKRFPTAKLLRKGDRQLIAAWNAGDVPLLLVHPQSGGHGLNIQFGGRRVLWYGPIPTSDLELWLQLNDRLGGARSVGLGSTWINTLITVGTFDQITLDELVGKDGTQNRFKQALTALRQGSG